MSDKIFATKLRRNKKKKRRW